MSRRTLAATLALLALASAAHAMGNTQDCRPEDLAPVDAWLAKHPWQVGQTGPERLVAAACKGSPLDAAVTIVAAAYGQGDDEVRDGDSNFIAALVEPRRATLRSVFIGTLPEDAAMRIGRGSLGIDTARYDLAPGVRAFGIDVTSQASGPRCAEGGFGPLRTLFVQAGRSLRPVLASVELSSWRLVSGAACVGPEPEDKQDVVIENAATTISVGTQATHGLADLVLASTIDGRAARGRRLVLHYDGAAYVAKDDRIWPSVIVPEAAASR